MQGRARNDFNHTPFPAGFNPAPGSMLDLMLNLNAITRIAICTVSVFVLIYASSAFATEDYAMETGQVCSVCHISKSGGGGLTPAGESFDEDPDNWKPPAHPREKTPLYFRLIHLMLLYLHIIFGIVWIGTILYVHLVLKPKYALGGLPRSELRLAWASMPIIAVTGIFLTIWRLKITPGLFSTEFGKLLLLKITIFTLMLTSAAFVTLYVGPRLRQLVAAGQEPPAEGGEKDSFTPEKLRSYDGSQGDRILIAAQGQVYDVSSSPMWRSGMHARRHKAGNDLTEYLKNAPHDPKVLERFDKVGKLVTHAEKTPPVIRIFTLNAYFNLAGCFLIILILALWRW